MLQTIFKTSLYFFCTSFFLTASPNVSVRQCRSWVEGKHVGVPREARGVLQPFLFTLAVRRGSEGCSTAGGIPSVMANFLTATGLRWTEAGSSDISGGLFSARLFSFLNVPIWNVLFSAGNTLQLEFNYREVQESIPWHAFPVESFTYVVGKVEH